jgi:ATP-dependent protease ClpP protease subunit
LNAPFRNAVLHLDGFVGEDFSNAAVRDFLASAAGKPVTVEINSGGGFATEGAAIYATLAAYAPGVSVIVNGIAASAASLIAMAGRPIAMREGALMMIHDPAGMVIGNSEAMQAAAGTLEKIGDTYAAIYAKRSGKKPDEVRQLMRAETWFGPDEAVAAGFADVVLAEPAAAPAVFAYGKFKNAPALLLAVALKSETTEMDNIDVVDPPATEPVDKNAGKILGICMRAKLSPEATNKVLIDAKGDTAKASAMVIDMMVDADPDKGASFPTSAATITLSDTFANPSFLSKTIEDAIFCQASGKAPEKAATAEWMGRPLIDMGAALLQANGVKITSMHRDRLSRQILAPVMAGGQHTTSDFPAVLGNAMNRMLQAAYQANDTALNPLFKQSNSPDFRELQRTRMGDLERLDEVPEGGEIKYGTREEEGPETNRVKTYGKLFAVTRQLIINDDLGAMATMAQDRGRAAAQTKADAMAALLTANGGAGVKLSDNAAIFTAGRGNKSASGTAISVVSLGAGRQAIREVKGVDGKTPLSIAPKYLVVGAEQETWAETILADIAAAEVANVNPFSGKLQLIVDSRLTGTSWRLFADPSVAPILEIAYLNGVSQPQLEQRDGWDVLGIEYRTVFDFGVAAIGWRGAYLNDGALPG